MRAKRCVGRIARSTGVSAIGDLRAAESTLRVPIVVYHTTAAALTLILVRPTHVLSGMVARVTTVGSEVGRFELGETSGLDEEVVRRFRKLDIAAGQTGLGEAIANREPLQLPDVTKTASNPLRDAALQAGLHAALIVPLLGNEGALGALVLQRRRVGEFPSSVVSLMQSFA